MGNGVLGGFEHQVLLAVLRLGDEGAYTIPVVDVLEESTGRTPAPAAVFTTLKRLERRGLLHSRIEPSPVGGRPRRLFFAEPEATDLLRESRRALERLWSAIPSLEGGDA
jgi:DNA-binding PadR family transcriptional regulator